MTQRTGAQLLVETLLAQDIEMGFGVPGESYLAVLDALYDVSNSFKFINARNEGGASFMAEAYGKLTGKPGICFVTRGPGVTNASIGIHTAMQDSTPMIVFVGQVETSMRGREAFQELDYPAVFGTMAKWAVEIDSADRVPELVSRAFAVAQSGRPGPVVVSLPEDMLVQTSSARVRGYIKPAQASPADADVSNAMEMLAKAKSPLVLIGGGGWNASGLSHLQKFVEANQLPVAVAFRNQDMLDNLSPSYVGDAGVGMSADVRKMLADSDLLLAINVRFGEIITDGYNLYDPVDFEKKLIHIHASDDELGKIFTPDLAILSGPNHAVEKLASQVAINDPVWAEATKSAHETWQQSLIAPEQPGDLDMGVICAYLDKKLPQDTIITNGAGNFSAWPGRHITYSGTRKLVGPQAGAMGAGVPTAVMAKILDPTRFVLCFAGDGDFQMNCQELGTSLQYGTGPIILILNNGQYGTIRMHQERDYPNRVSGTALVNPDFPALARSYGFHGERVEKTADFEAAFERACASPTGAVIELVVDPEGLSPRLTVAQLHKATQ